jgi:hypothetical protein
MSTAFSLTKLEQSLQQTYCTRRDLEILGAEIRCRKWTADLLDDSGDACGRIMLGDGSSLNEHKDFSWSCQLGVHFGSSKWLDGPLACGHGSTPQEAYSAACACFEKNGYSARASYFREINS